MQVIGNVEIFKTNQGWIPASNGDTLTLEDKIRTGETARAELEYDDGTILRMKSGCELVLLENSIKLSFGDTWIKAVKRGTRFKVITPTAVAGVKGTIFEVDVTRDNGETRVAVFNGIVEVSAMNTRILLFSARQTTIRHGQPPEKAVYFDKWRQQKTWADNLWKPEKQELKPKPGKKSGLKPITPETGSSKQPPPVRGALQWPPVEKIRPEGEKPHLDQRGPEGEKLHPDQKRSDGEKLHPDQKEPEDRAGASVHSKHSRKQQKKERLSRERYDRSPSPEKLRHRFQQDLGRELGNEPNRTAGPTNPGRRPEAASVEDLKDDARPPWKRPEYKERVDAPTAKEGFTPAYRDRSNLEISDRKDLHHLESASPIPFRPRPGESIESVRERPFTFQESNQFLESFSKLPRKDQDRILDLIRTEREHQMDILRERMNDEGNEIPFNTVPPPGALPDHDMNQSINQLQNLNELFNINRLQDPDHPKLPGKIPGGLDSKLPGKLPGGIVPREPGSAGEELPNLDDIRRIRPPRGEELPPITP